MKNINLKNIIAYIQGWTRYYMYYRLYHFDRWIIKRVTDNPFTGGRDFTIKEKIYYQYSNFIYDLLPFYIRQQIEIRIKSSLDCVLATVCKICKCDTPALQMANKACDKPCYPAMMNKKDWEEFYGNGEHTPRKWYYCKETKLEWSIFDNKFITKQEYLEKRFKNE